MTPCSAVIIGVLAGVIPFIFCYKVKAYFGYDDALDTFGVHAVGGTLGAFLTGIFADPAVNANLASDWMKEVVGKTLWLEQLKAMGLTLVISITATIIIGLVIKSLIGLRPAPEVEEQGLDLNEHGEAGYVV